MKRLHIIGGPSTLDAEVTTADMARLVDEAIGLSSELEVSFCSIDKLGFLIGRDVQKIVNSETGEDLASYNLIWFRGRLASSAHLVATVANYLRVKGVKSLNSAYEQRRAIGKIPQMFLLAEHNLPMPKTIAGHHESIEKLVAEHLTFPVVAKDSHASHGDRNFLVHSAEELHDILLKYPDAAFMVQEFIKSEGDYRIFFAGDRSLIIHRLATGDTHLNNTSQGATARLIDAVDFSPEILHDAKVFAKACGYEIAGVDVIIDSKAGQHYFLEINSQPQIATGAFVEQKEELIGDLLRSLLA